MIIQQIRNATLKITYSDMTFLVDPWLQDTSAIHGDNEMVAEMMGQVHGYYITGEEKSLYIAGDTVMCNEVADFMVKTRPDVITINALNRNE